MWQEIGDVTGLGSSKRRDARSGTSANFVLVCCSESDGMGRSSFLSVCMCVCVALIRRDVLVLWLCVGPGTRRDDLQIAQYRSDHHVIPHVLKKRPIHNLAFGRRAKSRKPLGEIAWPGRRARSGIWPPPGWWQGVATRVGQLVWLLQVGELVGWVGCRRRLE